MSEPLLEGEVAAEHTPAVIDAAVPLARPAIAPALPIGRPAQPSALERAQLIGNRALA